MSRKVPTLEANFVVSVWTGKGCCGQIVEADRRLAPGGQVMYEHIGKVLHAELIRAWPEVLSNQPLEGMPIKLVFNVVVERKEFICYGK